MAQYNAICPQRGHVIIGENTVLSSFSFSFFFFLFFFAFLSLLVRSFGLLRLAVVVPRVGRVVSLCFQDGSILALLLVFLVPPLRRLVHQQILLGHRAGVKSEAGQRVARQGNQFSAPNGWLLNQRPQGTVVLRPWGVDVARQVGQERAQFVLDLFAGELVVRVFQHVMLHQIGQARLLARLRWLLHQIERAALKDARLLAQRDGRLEASWIHRRPRTPRT